MLATPVRQQGPEPYVVVGRCERIFRVSTIGVLLRPAATTRGSRVSASAISSTPPRTPRSTSVQCGLFNNEKLVKKFVAGIIAGFYTRRSAGVLLLVGVVVGVTVGGFAVVRATSGSSSASSFVPLSPVRVLDTRSDLGLAAVTDGVAGTLKVTGLIPTATSNNAVVVPVGATAVVLNVTAVNPTAGGYVSLRPGDATGAPTVSTLNVTAGGTFPNGATITVPTSGAYAGQIQVWYEAEGTTVGSTELLIDIAGYYELASSGAGAAGAKGDTGAAGAKGDTGAAGANGDTGATGTDGRSVLYGAGAPLVGTGANGDFYINTSNSFIHGPKSAGAWPAGVSLVGLTGAKGDTGAAGAKGDTGTAGATGAKGDTGATGASVSFFSARSVCGSNGTTLCAVGVQGPGGGTVFYVDTEGKYGDFDYLEVAPTDASINTFWSTTTAQCGITTPPTSCTETFVSTSGEALNLLAIGTGRAATAVIVARHDAGAVSKTDYAAGVADAYTTPTASDWFLPSKDELNEVCKYARNTGQAAGAGTVCAGGVLREDVFSSYYYWSSSEDAGYYAWVQDFSGGSQYTNFKATRFNVRPVRAF